MRRLTLALLLFVRVWADNFSESGAENPSGSELAGANASAPDISELVVVEVVAGSGGFEARRVTYPVPAQQMDDKARNSGLFDGGTLYGQNELFHRVRWKDSTEGLIWQVYGQNDVGKLIYLMWLSADKSTAGSTRITMASFGNLLAGACTIGSGNILYLEIGDIMVWAGDQLITGFTIDKSVNCKAWMVKYDPVGQKEVDRTEPDTHTIDLFNFAEWMASLKHDPKTSLVGVTFGHTMQQILDGLNHHQASHFVWDLQSEKLTVAGVQSPGGHCFHGTIFTSSDGGFLDNWLCDNTQRGTQLIRLTEEIFDGFIDSQVKTRHHSSPRNPSDIATFKYDEICADGKTFYKWSNDNQVYGDTAMPAAMETDDVVVEFFGGEPPSLNSDYEETVMMPRNLGWVKVGESLKEKKAPFHGLEDEGGYYGHWHETWRPKEHSSGCKIWADVPKEECDRPPVDENGASNDLAEGMRAAWCRIGTRSSRSLLSGRTSTTRSSWQHSSSLCRASHFRRAIRSWPTS